MWFPIVFLIGVLVGTNAAAVWMVYRLRKPEVAREILKNCYRTSHLHWLQVSEDDETPVCPCCGFSEERRKVAILEKLKEEAAS
jgi:hypothetical protein